MGTGSDIAIDASAVTLVQGDLRHISTARSISNATVRNMKQNLVFAFLYNALGIPLAAGVLYPFTGLLLSPMIAAAAMSLSSVSVIANSLRLRRAKGLRADPSSRGCSEGRRQVRAHRCRNLPPWGRSTLTRVCARC